MLLTGTWITGAIGAPKDVDYYSFSAPDGARDRIAIEFKNQSTTLEPRLELFDAEKTSQGEVHKTTSGADLIYRFVAIPGGRHTVRVSNYYGESTGVYALRVEPTKSFDGFEPNDGILAAKPLALQQSAEANVLDGRDADYYRFPVGEGEHSLDVKVENRSTTLHPKIALFDNTKSEVGSTHNSTPGGDARYTFKANGPATYYVRVSDYYGNGSGDYTLTVATQ